MNKLALAASLPLILGTSCTTEPQQPNLVVLFVDDLGWADLGYQNDKFHTPHIDALKERGLYFERAYVPTATSSPSRAALITGRESLRTGFVRHIYDTHDHLPLDQRPEFQTFDADPGNMKSRAWLPLEEITYAERLKELGYYNFFAGKWHLGHENFFPDKQGFDECWALTEHGHPNNYYNVPFFKTQNPFPNMSKDTYLTEILTDGVVRFIDEYDKNQPYLLNLWYYTVHGPHYGRKDYVKDYMAQGMSKKDAHYAAMVRSLDNSVGEILAALDRNGDADNTMIVFVSDQGGAFQNGHLRGGKQGGDTLAEGGTRVPMIVYYPNMKGMGTTYTQPVSTIDVFPTLVEMATGQPCTDAQLNGVSLVPVLEGGELAERNIFLHRSYEDQNSALIQGDWKLIKYRSGKLELYNISTDESEQNNLVTTEPERTSEMLTLLNEWQTEATPSYLID